MEKNYKSDADTTLIEEKLAVFTLAERLPSLEECEYIAEMLSIKDFNAPEAATELNKIKANWMVLREEQQFSDISVPERWLYYLSIIQLQQYV